MKKKTKDKGIEGSIMQSPTDTRCYIHLKYMGLQVNGTEQHHCIHGQGRRALADEDGLVVMLCPTCHRALHDKRYHDRDLQVLAQLAWEVHYSKSAQDFIDRYGKSYL